MTDVTIGAINFEGYVNKRVKLQCLSRITLKRYIHVPFFRRFICQHKSSIKMKIKMKNEKMSFFP